MAFKAASLIMAPDGDPTRHKATIKTDKLELTAVVVELMNFDQAVDVCKDLVQNQGVQSLSLCPGFTHEAVARIKNAVGEGVAVHVARGDIPSNQVIGEILTREGWLPKGP
ncbi:hypothetical protein KAU37_09905 [Candidatus Bipolaricaulota bacterium]|nr:hypothetical protein [Candidatus Bipolaricaulota bacterium]